jgi:hypothetical protein
LLSRHVREWQVTGKVRGVKEILPHVPTLNTKCYCSSGGTSARRPASSPAPTLLSFGRLSAKTEHQPAVYSWALTNVGQTNNWLAYTLQAENYHCHSHNHTHSRCVSCDTSLTRPWYVKHTLKTVICNSVCFALTSFCRKLITVKTTFCTQQTVQYTTARTAAIRTVKCGSPLPLWDITAFRVFLATDTQWMSTDYFRMDTRKCSFFWMTLYISRAQELPAACHKQDGCGIITRVGKHRNYMQSFGEETRRKRTTWQTQ